MQVIIRSNQQFVIQQRRAGQPLAPAPIGPRPAAGAKSRSPTSGPWATA